MLQQCKQFTLILIGNGNFLLHQNLTVPMVDTTATELDSASINFLCWNIQKGLKLNWQEDLSDLANGKDLVIIQEAVLHSDLTEAFSKSVHWSFAKGYKTKKHTTGVMTISKYEPIRRHQLICWEPWLATPKCTNITEYALSDTEETLVVVNIHAINFTLGLKQFCRQIDKIRKELAKHNGPIILSGDFNTWRKKRMKIIDAFAVEHQLNALSFQEDHRKAVFGQVLDHVYVRALTPESTDTYNVNSSDHNPISAELRF
ncbi:MAG: endonuclease/exonuclease/phosphatase family protein [Gammaproteobacteria bacterium]